jgi:hypothetical protein
MAGGPYIYQGHVEPPGSSRLERKEGSVKVSDGGGAPSKPIPLDTGKGETPFTTLHSARLFMFL